MPLTIPAKAEHTTFLYSEPCADLDALSADIAYLGIPYGRILHLRRDRQRPEPRRAGHAPGDRPDPALHRAL